MKVLLDIKWGARGMVALYLSLLSGIILALQYDPAHPYYSTSIIDTLVPFGLFWRSLHFYSSQLFFLLVVLHFIVVLIKKPPALATAGWFRLVISMLVVLLLLFTGYILRADTTGSSAGRIAENIILSIPVLGRILNSLLFDINSSGLQRVYVNHLVGLGMLWLFLIWPHVRRYMVNWRQFPWLVLAVLTWSALIPAPMEPAKTGAFHITGPWFFIGLQELLRHIPPFWAGIFWPSTLVAGLLLLVPENPGHRRAGIWVISWLVLYLLLTILGL